MFQEFLRFPETYGVSFDRCRALDISEIHCIRVLLALIRVEFLEMSVEVTNCLKIDCAVLLRVVKE